MRPGIRVLVTVVVTFLVVSLWLSLGCEFEWITWCPRYLQMGHHRSQFPSSVKSCTCNITDPPNHGLHPPLANITTNHGSGPEPRCRAALSTQPIVNSTCPPPLPIPRSKLHTQPPDVPFPTQSNLKYLHNACFVNGVITIYCGRHNEHCTSGDLAQPQGPQEYIAHDSTSARRRWQIEYKHCQDIPTGSWMREYAHVGYYTCEGNHFHFYHETFMALFAQTFSSGVTDAHQHALIISDPPKPFDYSQERDGCHGSTYFSLFQVAGFGFDPPYENIHYLNYHPQGQCYRHMTLSFPLPHEWHKFMVAYILEYFANKIVCPTPPRSDSQNTSTPNGTSSPYIAIGVVQRTKTRQFMNVEELLSALRTEMKDTVFRVDMVRFEDFPSIFDQYEAIKCFDIMLVANGAGATALAFLKQRSVVIEICPHGFGCHYEGWAIESGMQWTPYYPGPVSTTAPPGATFEVNKAANINLNIDSLVQKVKEMVPLLDHLKKS